MMSSRVDKFVSLGIRRDVPRSYHRSRWDARVAWFVGFGCWFGRRVEDNVSILVGLCCCWWWWWCGLGRQCVCQLLVVVKFQVWHKQELVRFFVRLWWCRARAPISMRVSAGARSSSEFEAPVGLCGLRRLVSVAPTGQMRDHGGDGQ